MYIHKVPVAGGIKDDKTLKRRAMRLPLPYHLNLTKVKDLHTEYYYRLAQKKKQCNAVGGQRANLKRKKHWRTKRKRMCFTGREKRMSKGSAVCFQRSLALLLDAYR